MIERVDKYQSFLASKTFIAPTAGIKVARDDLNDSMFPFQKDLVSWALKRGRAAIFADCGMGKTLMQLEWARHVGDVLILAPLAVAHQTVREAEKFGISAHYCRSQDMAKPGINVTNYEMLEHFDPAKWRGIVLDESSILKSYDGKTRTIIIESFKGTPYRLACTATPAPNDFMELGNHAEFLGVMSRTEMLSMFFVHDGGDTQKWRLKGHAEDEFWKWLASWSAMIRAPSDLGYDDGDFVLPPLIHEQITVAVDHAPEGMLFALEAETLQERLAARRSSVEDRVAVMSEIVNASTEPWLLWCNLNRESESLARAIPDAVDVRGSDSTETKEDRLSRFVAGDIRVLVTKPSIAGFGMNFQHCRNVGFVGLSDSWEQYYQAVRRCWRFGQTKPVKVYTVTAETEGAVVSNIRRKEADATRMADNIVTHMRTMMQENVRGTERTKDDYAQNVTKGDGWAMHLGDCVDVAQSIDNNSIGYSVFSPPFASLYTYSASDRDMGNCKNEDEFFGHFRFLIDELHRVTMPGRLVSVHCMDLPTTKTHHGVIGLRDFRGDVVRAFEDAGFIYHSCVTIWKDPVTAMQRTKAIGLLHKQLKKDSAMSRQGIPDYVVTFRKIGVNSEPISHTADEFPVHVWQRHASPVWMDINPSDTLQHRSVREHKDERHIAPLQLEVIRRCINLWSNPGDLVMSPFAGIGSEGYIALQMGRRFVGAELKRSYWGHACANLAVAADANVNLLSPLTAELTK